MTYPMTGTAIDDFQAKATGPSVLVSGLRSKTRVLGVFFKEVSHMDSLQAKIPPNVLGGGLSGLLSKRLRQLLDYSQQTGELENKNSANRPGFTGPFPIEEVNKNKSLFDHGAAEDTMTGFAPGKQDVEMKSNGFKPVSLPAEENEKAAALPGPFQQAMQGHREPTAGITGSDSPLLPVRETSTGEDEKKGGTPGGIFVEKLNEYFQLNRQEPSPEPGTHPIPAVDRRWGKGNQGKAPALPYAAVETRRPGPGFKMSEEQVARELRTFIDGRGDISPAGRSGQVYSTNGIGDGDIRIQNTFNINLDHEGTRETGTLGSLTEKIADILREQAIQHGIDIT